MNTSSAADLLKDPSNPTDGFLNNNSFTQHNVNLTGNEMKPSSSDWTNSSTIFASINNRALMNQSLNSNAEDKMLMFDGNPGFLDNSNNTEMEPTWVEVTNKANQTPSHWVYNDMTSQDIDENATTNMSGKTDFWYPSNPGTGKICSFSPEIF